MRAESAFKFYFLYFVIQFRQIPLLSFFANIVVSVMGLLTKGTPLSWSETVPYVKYIKVRKEFILL